MRIESSLPLHGILHFKIRKIRIYWLRGHRLDWLFVVVVFHTLVVSCQRVDLRSKVLSCHALKLRILDKGHPASLGTVCLEKRLCFCRKLLRFVGGGLPSSGSFDLDLRWLLTLIDLSKMELLIRDRQ